VKMARILRTFPTCVFNRDTSPDQPDAGPTLGVVAPSPKGVESGAASLMEPLGREGSSGTWAQLTAFFTSAPIFLSSEAVTFFSAKEVGHISPWSRFASALKPSVAYLSLNFEAGVKKQTTLPSLLA
jgi:hypothetical protein